MKILITGGVGFIGQHLARRLVADGHKVLALDNLNPQVHLDPSGAVAAFPGDTLVGDVAEPAAWQDVPACDAVVHLAAETGTGQSMYEQDRYRRVNVGGTRLAVQQAISWQSPIVVLSSRAVYGEGRAECPVHGTGFGSRCCDEAIAAASTEDDPHAPVSVYGETKSEAEQEIRSYGGPVPTVIIRPQNVIGPGQALHNPYTGVLAAFLARLREGRPLSVYGDGSQTRDFIHVQDLARIIAWSLDAAPAKGDLVLNAGSGVRTTLLELAAYANEGAPRADVPVELVDVHRSGDIQDACADLTRLQDLGATTPQWSTRDAVVDFISWSWDKPGVASQAWDQALDELAQRGLTT